MATPVNAACYPSFFTYGTASGSGCQQAPTEETISTSSVCDRWCGKWNTKEEALNSLFSLYRRKTGKVIKWYVNWEGYLEWFEVGEREGVEYFFKDTKPITTLKFTSDASNIKNYLTGSYGEGDAAGLVTVSNSSSITIYGKRVDDSFQDVCMDQTEMTAYLNKKLAILSVPVYNATVELVGFYHIEPGKQIVFPDDIKYSSKIWTVVDWNFSDEGGNAKTTLNLTTDESVISLPNEFEIIQSTAQSEVDKSLPEAAVVTSIIDGEYILVTKERDGSKHIVRSLATNE